MSFIKAIGKGIAGIAFLAAAHSTAFGVPQITINGNNEYRAGLGGEFNIVAANAEGRSLLEPNLVDYKITNGTTVGTADGTRMGSGFGGLAGFETFCIEYNEYISLPGTYNAAISLGSVYGGVGGGIDHDNNPLTPTTDFISLGTAYLYQAFATGNLTGYNYGNGSTRAGDAVLLQNAFWVLENEIPDSAAGGGPGGNKFLNLAISRYGSLAAARANNNIWDVAVLNLGGPAPNQKQDQLILHKNGFHVPDGGLTVTLLGLSFAGLAFIRRKLS